MELPNISSSLFTMRGTMEFEAGRKNPETVPKASAKAYSIHICMLPEKTTSASKVINTNRRISEASMIDRWENRSVSAPPTSINTALGIPMSARTKPRASGSPVIKSTSQGRAIIVN